MHSLLEQYLDEVAAHLTALPAARRDEELREMRQHLLNAVIVNREMGQTEDEAAANAVEQFGTPTIVGQSVVASWRHAGRKKNARSFWITAAAAGAVFTVECVLRPHVIVPFIPLFGYALLLMGWKRLTPQAAPAWWAYQSRPSSSAQCWLTTALYLVQGFLLLFAGMTTPMLHFTWAVIAALTGGLWLRWYWEQRRASVDGPAGAA